MTSVYISNEHIQAVSAVRSGKKLTVKMVAEQKLPEGCILNGVITDEAALKTELSAMWKAFKLPRKGLRLVLESGAVSTKLLNLPNLSKPEYMNKLISDNLPGSEIEEAVYDYKTLGAAPEGGISVLACMAERSFIKSYIELFSGAGLKLASIDLAVSGLIRLVKFCGEFSDRTFVISVIDRNNVSQFLFIKGEYRFSNRTTIARSHCCVRKSLMPIIIWVMSGSSISPNMPMKLGKMNVNTAIITITVITISMTG